MEDSGVIMEFNQEKEENINDELCSNLTEDNVKMERREKGKQLFFIYLFFRFILEQLNL